MRRYYKNGKLTNDKIKKLEKLHDWFWEKKDNFDKMLEQLIKWIEENKKIPSHGSKNETEKKLGNWCTGQRREKKKGKLTDDKIKKIEKLNGWYWSITIKKNKH